MSVTRHQDVDLLLGSINHDGDEILEVLLDGRSFLELSKQQTERESARREGILDELGGDEARKLTNQSLKSVAT